MRVFMKFLVILLTLFIYFQSTICTNLFRTQLLNKIVKKGLSVKVHNHHKHHRRFELLQDDGDEEGAEEEEEGLSAASLEAEEEEEPEEEEQQEEVEEEAEQDEQQDEQQEPEGDTLEKRQGFFKENDFDIDESTDIKDGRDDSKPIMTITAFVKRDMKYPSDVKRGFFEMQAKVNSDVIYLANVGDADDYKKILVSLSLKDLLHANDKADHLKCCQNVHTIQTNIPVQIDGEESMTNCFTIQHARQNWELCSENLQELSAFREKLLVNIVIAGGYLKLSGVTIPKDPIIFNPSFTWSDQNGWKGICKSGSSQSPIAIDFNVPRPGNLVFIYEPIEVPGMVPKEHNIKTAVFENNEIRVKGAFGKMKHIDGETNVEYVVDYVNFKFPAEHIMYSHKYEGEIQVHHTSQSGAVAIVSFMIRLDDTVDPNTFVGQLDLPLWKLQDGESTEITGNPLLEELVSGGITEFMNKNFYWYVGSETSPPCGEAINHFILETPIRLNQADIDLLRSKSYDNTVEGQGNARTVQPKGLRTIYFSQDIVQCGVVGDPEVVQNGQPVECGEVPEDPMQVVKDAKDSGIEGEGFNKDSIDPDQRGTSQDKGTAGNYPGSFYVEHVKIKDRVWVPEEGARSIVLGDLGNGVVVEEETQEVNDTEKKRLQAEYHARNEQKRKRRTNKK